MNTVTTEFLVQTNLISPLDSHFSKFIDSFSKEKNKIISLSASLVSKYTGKGHICLDLSALENVKHYDENGAVWSYPAPDKWKEKISDHPAIGKPGEHKPVIVDGNKIYLFRYWQYENYLIRQIKKRSEKKVEILDEKKLKAGINRLFPIKDEIDWQKIAACSALLNKFSVISGGPGTGKTTTVVKILTLHLEQNSNYKILLAAPTGKAASRLNESIAVAKKKIECEEEIRRKIPTTVQTIHRLLKKTPNSPYFYHNEERPLDVDIIVIDEASMIDLPLMAKLFCALPEHCSILLIGDKNQLASVEVGAVFGDICGGEKEYGHSMEFSDKLLPFVGKNGVPEGVSGRDLLQDSIVQLRKNYRFGDESGIALINKLIVNKNHKTVLELLEKGSFTDIVLKSPQLLKVSNKALTDVLVKGYEGLFKEKHPADVFRSFESFRILSPLRKGTTGVEGLNRLVESALKEKKLISSEGPWYHGRPVLITKNDYVLNLFNGDIGIALMDREVNALRVFFQREDGTYISLLPQRLPEHETAYCMTVHKSQGSEFGSVLLILPEVYTPILSHEVLYTGISRAKERVEIWGNKDIIETAIKASVERSSGLMDALWPDEVLQAAT